MASPRTQTRQRAAAANGTGPAVVVVQTRVQVVYGVLDGTSIKNKGERVFDIDDPAQLAGLPAEIEKQRLVFTAQLASQNGAAPLPEPPP
jgi:hypothetical protein